MKVEGDEMYGVMEIPVTECSEGDVLASDVYNSSGIALVTKETVLNQYLKNKLLHIGIENLRIYGPPNISGKVNTPDREFTESYKDAVLHYKQMVNAMTAGKKLDYDHVLVISDLIYENMNQSESMIKYLHEIRSNDEYTYAHSVNTAFYCMLIAKWLELPEQGVIKAIQAGLLHDIGKSRVPVEVLNRKGFLSPEDFELIKKHPVFGYEVINDIKGVDSGIKQAVLFHHERIDRSGYPFQLSPDDIGLYARIVAVSDVFDAMTSDRVYKKRSTPFEAFHMFQRVGVHIFDVNILNTFLKNIAACYVGSMVLLNNGEKGQIVHVPPDNIVGPIVAVRSRYVDCSQLSELAVARML